MYILSAISYFIALLVFLPLVHSSYWVFRVLEYPRFQKFLVVAACILSWGAYYTFSHQPDWIAIGLLGIAIIYLSVKIFPYTVLARKEIKDIALTNEQRSIKILAANVLQYNTAYHRLLQQIKQADPDIIMLLETDMGWANAMEELKDTYPYCILEPLDNTYGLLFYSRYRLIRPKVKYLVKDDIPSVDTIVELPDGTKVQLWGLHPEPPVPGESLTSTAKDKELMKIALKAKESKLPVIVMGDLNDVAWSYTTTLFTRTSQLLDVRKGRGFYSTFSAKSRFIRFPLDYIFCSSDFGLISMKRLPYNGSDHFPMLTQLMYTPAIAPEQEKPMPEKEDVQDAVEIASQRVEEE